MSFWSRLIGRTTPYEATDDYAPGDADGVEFDNEPTYSRSLPYPVPSPWSGWPSDWETPRWENLAGLNKLIDTAWAAIDLNASVLASMPAYRLRDGEIVEPLDWQANPDPLIYSSWHEFMKQLMWDYHLGEAFVLPMSYYGNGFPRTFRVVPPALINVDLTNGTRTYSLGGQDVSDEILHIRYQSNVADAHGHGPLECAGARMTSAGLLQRYAHTLAETGGVPLYWIGVDRTLNAAQANDMIDQWVESRRMRAGQPALLSGGATLNQASSMNAKDMALLELSQFNESRISILLGVPPFLMGLPAGSGGDGSMTYSNVSQLFTFHDKASLQPKATAVMAALSNWLLPPSESVELNRDEYSRPSFKERFDAYKIAVEMGAMSVQEVRSMERLHGRIASSALTGNNLGVSPQQHTQLGAQASGGNS